MVRLITVGLVLVGARPGGSSHREHTSPKHMPRTLKSWRPVSDSTENWSDKALTALESATTFFERSYDRIILDGIFGLRVAEGK